MTGIVLQRLITAPMGPESSQQHRNVGVQLSATEEVDKSCSQEVTYRRMGSPIPSWQNIKRTFGPFAAYAWNSCRTEDELGFERQGKPAPGSVFKTNLTNNTWNDFYRGLYQT